MNIFISLTVRPIADFPSYFCAFSRGMEAETVEMGVTAAAEEALASRLPVAEGRTLG